MWKTKEKEEPRMGDGVSTACRAWGWERAGLLGKTDLAHDDSEVLGCPGGHVHEAEDCMRLSGQEHEVQGIVRSPSHGIG